MSPSCSADLIAGVSVCVPVLWYDPKARQEGDMLVLLRPLGLQGGGGEHGAPQAPVLQEGVGPVRLWE